MNPTIKVTTGGQEAAKKFAASLAALTKYQVYVGIPTTTAAARMADIMGMALGSTGKLKKRLLDAAKSQVNNAELMYIHSHGSQLKGIPARPVIEPAIAAPGNKELIAAELEQAAKAAMEGSQAKMVQFLNRAGLVAQNACRKWFTDPRNNWAPNKPSTIKAKGSSRPLIDTGELRKSITYVVSDAG